MGECKRIRIDYSDGDAKQVPRTQADGLSKGPDVDYFQILPAGHLKHDRWMKFLGACIKSETSLKEDDNVYVLSAFPTGYALFEHNTSQDSGLIKTDLYLYGHPSGARYRSPNEFMPHALWLATDRTHTPTNCLCKLCPNIGKGVALLRSGPPLKGKTLYTGMSVVAGAQFQKASCESFRDLDECAPVYRVGEIVLFNATVCIVSAASGGAECDSLKVALSHHKYTLFGLDAPYPSHEHVSSYEIKPYLSGSSSIANLQAPAIIRSASPVAKYSIQTTTASFSLLGPSYVAWFIGPEKIYHNDLVRLHPGMPSQEEGVMHLSRIVLNIATKEIRVRGDIFEFSDAAPSLYDDRSLPQRVLQIAHWRGTRVRFMNRPGVEFEVPMSQVSGRLYQPCVVTETLASNSIKKVVRGRVTALPEELVHKLSSLFDEVEA